MNCTICASNKILRTFTVTCEDKYRTLAGPNAPEARYFECANCGAMIFNLETELGAAYQDGQYYSVDGDPKAALLKRFNQIINLPPEKSDNVARVNRIKSFLDKQTQTNTNSTKRNVLDIGAGMGVFLRQFLDLNWQGFAVEPEPNACAHMRDVLSGVQVLEGLSSELTHSTQYDLITLNRVLEHVPDPVNLLKAESSHLKDSGYLYIEVPDSASFYLDGPNNEAFGYTHYIVYSPAALCLVAKQAGFEMCELSRTVEPSGKFTLYGFFSRKRSGLENAGTETTEGRPVV